jgi:hypothetical protein
MGEFGIATIAARSDGSASSALCNELLRRTTARCRMLAGNAWISASVWRSPPRNSLLRLI